MTILITDNLNRLKQQKGYVSMKYSEYHSKSKFNGSPAFYIILACCLLAIGGAAWFAASEISSRGTQKEQSSDDSGSSVYTPPQSSILSESSEQTPSGQVDQNVSDEPYSSEETTSADAPAKEPAVTFSMPVQGEIIKDYSDKELQYSATYGDMRIHTGIDIACEDGTSVSAAGSGSVLSVEESVSLGTVVTIDHGSGITAKYASIKDAKVKAGDKVAAGDIIGSVTSIPGECADQSHLHFEITKDGHSAEPLGTLGLK